MSTGSAGGSPTTTSYAIVIGINAYTAPGTWPRLVTPVSDALKAAEWLLTPAPAGGGVDPDNILLLLGTGAPGPIDLPALAAQASVRLPRVLTNNVRGATQRDIRKAATDLRPRMVTDGTARLYFIYSGHGAQFKTSVSVSDAIIPSDTETDAADPISRVSVQEYFAGLQIPEQFFIFDCCRNPVPLQVQPVALAAVPETAGPPRSQYVLNATARGTEAKDTPPTVLNAVLDGLRGAGRAKLWDLSSERFVVKFPQLYGYLAERFKDNPSQVPSRDGEQFGDPVIAAPDVKKVPLRVAFQPGPPKLTDLRGRVRLTWFDAQRVTAVPVSTTPLVIPVFPGRYGVEIEAQPPGQGLDAQRILDIGADPVEWAHDFNTGEAGPVQSGPSGPSPVVAPTPSAPPPPAPTPSVVSPGPVVSGTTLTPAALGGTPSVGGGTGLTAAPDPPGAAGVSVGAAPVTLSAAPVVLSAAPVGDPAEVAFSLPADAGLCTSEACYGTVHTPEWEEYPVSFAPTEGGSDATLTIKAGDPVAFDRVAPLELLDGSGSAVNGPDGKPLMGLGKLVCKGLPGGVYLARWAVPEGASVEEHILWQAKKDEEVALTVPAVRQSSLMRELTGRLGGSPEDRLVAVSRVVGASLFPGVGTVLALASAATKRTGVWTKGHGDRLRGLGVGTTGAKTGRATAGHAELLLAIESEVETDEAAEFLKKVQVRVSGLGESDAPTGTTLTPVVAATPGVATVHLPNTPGPKWVWLESPDGDAGAFPLVVLRGRTTQLVFNRPEDGRIRVFQFCPTATTKPDTIRQLDLAQRFLDHGDIRHALLCVEALLDGSDPVAGCLGGHLLIRNRDSDRLGNLAKLMVRKFPTLPDSRVLLGRYHEMLAEDDKAAAAYKAALDHGLPTFGVHLKRLDGGVRRYAIEHDRVPLLQRVAKQMLPGLLWTGWLPSCSYEHDTAPAGEPSAHATSGEFSPSPESGVPTMPTTLTAAPPPAAPADALPVATAFPSASGPPPRRCLCGNQANAGPYIPSLPATRSVRTRAVIDMTNRWQNGTTINIGFMNANPAVEAAVKQYAPFWLDFANLQFQFVTASVHIAINTFPIQVPSAGINYGVDTFNSFHGRDCHKYFAESNGQIPSMNLIFRPQLPNDAEVRRLILHEFGHALSFAHEHMSPAGKLNWNMAVLRFHFQQNGPGWSDQMIQQQIMDVYQPAGHDVRASAFDLTSIMMYGLPSGCATFQNGQPFGTTTNFDLSARDKVMANMVYPFPTSAALPEQPLGLGTPKDGSITSPGQVARYAFQATAGTAHVIEVGGGMPFLVSLLNTRGEPNGMWAEENGPIGFTPDTTGEMYAEVRHSTPRTGTGNFTVTVRTT